ncbi:PH domain-containing protein [Isoptericola halotolerans]|uniref:YdbS-like PH domain-containing protein n=1 Tax=Isoptericola halotolerans TaxID=300560 RepID=A0ABX2A306_9MICO|nr:PH domain-containing protein [Isoptericola halotolerans]NOV97237.1 hypothetical protein [Isoptericola halotolerans]
MTSFDLPVDPDPVEGITGPFDPPGIAWDRVSPRLTTARLVVLGLTLGLPILACAAVAVLVTPWVWLAAGFLAAILLWAVLLVPRQVRAIGYAERDDDLLIRKGILFRQLVVVPYGRMQFVDVQAGPLDRKLGIAKVQLHTAAASTDAVIPGLPPVEAERLRDRLTARGEAKLAGL